MKEDIKSIMSYWSLGKLISYKQAKKGVVNINWIIKTTKGKYVLRKVPSYKKEKDLKFELNYLTYLKKKFPYKIPAPILTKGQNSYVKADGAYLWLYEFIDGKHVKRFGYKELKQVAKMMATYHKIIEKSKFNRQKGGDPFNRKAVLGEMLRFKSKILRKTRQGQQDRIFIKESETLIPLFKSLKEERYAKFRRYPLHRDISQGNVLWKEGKLSGIIDFDQVSFHDDTRIRDLSIIVQNLYWHMNSDLYLRLAKFFLDDYRKNHKLSDEEITFIPDLVIAGIIETFDYSYWLILNDPKRAKPYRLRLYSKAAQWHDKNRDKMIRKIK